MTKKYTKKQFYQVKVGDIFLRPVFGTSIVYRKIADATDHSAGKSEVIDDLTPHEDSTGRVVTTVSSHVVYVCAENPVNDAERIAAAKVRAEYVNRPKGLPSRRLTRNSDL